MDPEPDMLALSKKELDQNSLWVRGTDRDVAAQGPTGPNSSGLGFAVQVAPRQVRENTTQRQLRGIPGRVVRTRHAL
jgi:hypothetical protein